MTGGDAGPMDVLSTFIGFIIGIVAAGFAVELGLKKLFAPPENSKLTTVWSLSELQSPEIVATSLADGVDVPKSARVVASNKMPPAKKEFQLRRNAEAKGSFALD